MLRTLPHVILFCAAAPLLAQGAEAHNQAVKAAYQAYLESRQAYQKQVRPLARAYGQLGRQLRSGRVPAGERAGVEAKMKKIRAQMTKARDAYSSGPGKDRMAAFVSAMKTADWAALAKAGEQRLLSQGLIRVANECIAAEPRRALAAYRAILELLPRNRRNAMIRSFQLPVAMIACGEIAAATSYLDKALAKGSEGAEARRMHLVRGDISAAQGALAAAREHWRKAADPKYGKLRLDRVGKPLPKLDLKTWVGARARPLAALRGKVLVVCFWASWNAPSRAMLPALDQLQEELGARGLRVVGVTRSYDRGYLPKDASQIQRGGEDLEAMAAADYPRHLAAFRNQSGIGFPFVMAGASDFERHGVQDIPMVVVVDAEGRVAYLGVGSGTAPLVRASVMRLLEN